MIKNITNLGDSALYCDFGNDVNKQINQDVIKYFKSIKSKKILGITNLTPSYNKLIVSFDLRVTNYEKIKSNIENIDLTADKDISFNVVKIPVCCDEEFSLDILRLEKHLKLNKEKILKNFFDKEYFCYMTGFIAGMPFLGDLDDDMRAKRLETPRVKVPRGSVGLTEQFCNIYSSQSPGGWNIIGNTPIKIFSTKNENNPNLINAGDKVIFYKITKKEYEKFNK